MHFYVNYKLAASGFCCRFIEIYPLKNTREYYVFPASGKRNSNLFFFIGRFAGKFS